MIYKIAGINVDMNIRYPILLKQGEAYLCEETSADMKIHLSDEFLTQCQKESPHLSLDECEYIWMGSEFYNNLPEFGGFLLHASAVVHNGKAYLFSAPSGTGKSTHTQLWLKRFDDAYILNDDKPAIKLTPEGFIVCGTPFSGKTDWNVNTSVPLGGICAVERSETNYIEKMSQDEALFRILNQTLRPYDEKKMEILLDILDKLIKSTPVYKLHCNMDIDAVDVAYKGMEGE